MSTNVEVDKAILDELRKMTGLKTQKEVVKTALEEFLRILKQCQILDYQGKIRWEGDLDAMRES